MSLIDSVIEGIRIEKVDGNNKLVEELTDAAYEGHSYIQKDRLVSTIENEHDNQIVIENNRVYLQYIHQAEVEAAEGVHRLLGVPAPEVDIPARPVEGNLIPTDQQWQAIENVFRHRFSVITGLPGTGKSTLVKLLLDLIDRHPYFSHKWQRYALACPTGKAAVRLSTVTNRDAETIHRALGYHPGSGFMHNASYPHWAEVMVIDEASMVNIATASALVNAIGPNTRLVLIGDGRQLPPVGAGRFFEEMTKHPEIPSTHLTQVFRQAGQSLIVQNAHRVINGLEPYQSTDEIDSETREDYTFFEKQSGRIPRFVSHLVTDVIPERFPNLNPLHHVMVIAPQRSSVAGLNNLNAELRKSLNPAGEPVGVKDFLVGDRILCISNRYNLDIMNGDTGIIIDCEHEHQRLTLQMGDTTKVVPFEELSNFVDGYAFTVHKSQGSEAQVVIFIADKYHKRMLTQELINTAITRAKGHCFVVGQTNTISQAVTQKIPPRRSTLSWRISQGGNHVNVPSDIAEH